MTACLGCHHMLLEEFRATCPHLPNAFHKEVALLTPSQQVTPCSAMSSRPTPFAPHSLVTVLHQIHLALYYTNSVHYSDSISHVPFPFVSVLICIFMHSHPFAINPSSPPPPPCPSPPGGGGGEPSPAVSKKNATVSCCTGLIAEVVWAQSAWGTWGLGHTFWGQVVFYPGHPGGKVHPQKAAGTNSCQTCTQTWKAACSEACCSQFVHPCG